MFDCFTSSHSVYFEGAFDGEFRKPIPFWFKLFRFIKKVFHYKKMLPYKWGHIMWKNDREKMDMLYFCDINRTINIFAEMKNPSYRTLFFDKATYEDLKSCIPPFLEHVGYKFNSETDESGLTLDFESVPRTNSQGLVRL